MYSILLGKLLRAIIKTKSTQIIIREIITMKTQLIVTLAVVIKTIISYVLKHDRITKVTE